MHTYGGSEQDTLTDLYSDGDSIPSHSPNATINKTAVAVVDTDIKVDNPTGDWSVSKTAIVSANYDAAAGNESTIEWGSPY